MEDINFENLNQYEIDFMNSSSINNHNIHLIQDNPEATIIFNPALFQTEILRQFFQNKNIIKNNVVCPECGKLCKLVNQNSSLDKKIWRCRDKNHDTKINLRKNSIIENSQQTIQMLYYIFFFCFTERKSNQQAFIDSNEFAKKLGIPGITKQTICNIYASLREKLRFNMHHLWSNNQLGEEIDENGFASIEIDVSEIIGSENTVYWMFGLIERRTKNARVFCVLSDRTKNRLLPIVKNNVLTNELEDDNLPETASTKHVFILTVSVHTKLMILKIWGFI